MSFWPLKKNTKECFLALDIGTEAVKALVFEKDPLAGRQGNQKYYILGSSLQYFDELRPFDDNKVILSAKEEAINQAGRNPKEFLLSFPPNILKSRIRTLSINRKNPKEIINKQEAMVVIESVLKETEKEITEYSMKYLGIMAQDVHFIEKEILEIKIDGYEVPDIFGYGGEKLEFKVLASFLPKAYFENFDNLFKRYDSKLKTANPLTNLGVLSAADGIFLDIGGEITQLCLIRNGKIEIIEEFGAGGRNFSQSIRQTLGMSFSEARFLKERYSKSDLTEETRARIKEILSPSADEWEFALKSKINGIKGLLPSTFFLFGGGSQLPEIEELITNNDKEVKFLSFKDFSAKGGSALGGKNIIDNTGRVNNPQFIGAILLLYDK